MQATPSPLMLIGFLPGYATDSERGYLISNVPGDQLDYLVYAFAGFAPAESIWIASTPEPNDPATNFASLQALQVTYPDLRLMISVGGWANSQIQVPAPGVGSVIAAIAASASARKAYVTSCIETFIRAPYPRFDGIDLDWEFPTTTADAANFAALAREFRTQLNAAGRVDGIQYMLSASVGIDPSLYGGPAWAEMQHSFDWVNLMAYNLNVPRAEPDQSITRFNAPLYASAAEPTPPGPNVYAGVQAYLKAGVAPGKIVLGVDAYARTYAGVDATIGGLYQPYEGIGPGTWSPGDVAYRDVLDNYLPVSKGAVWNDSAQASSLYIPDQNVWLSPQLEADVTSKATYVVQQRLAGLMMWELGADTIDQHSLLGYMYTAFQRASR